MYDIWYIAKKPNAAEQLGQCATTIEPVLLSLGAARPWATTVEGPRVRAPAHQQETPMQ